MLKIITIVGARPQFIKAAAVSRAIKNEYKSEVCEIIVHTGQHHDSNLSQVFFDELDIPHPKFNLKIAGGTHGLMTGRMLESIENVCIQEKPDWVLIYGDTNSTVAGALAAAKLHIPIAHVEAGLRSFNMRMPEEINRIIADRISTLLFCPTEIAIKNLTREGLTKGVFNVGDVMYDVAIFYRNICRQRSKIIQQLRIDSEFALVTCHRAENTDNPDNLKSILNSLKIISNKLPIIFPIHPRTLKQIKKFDLLGYLKYLTVIQPLPFLDMMALEQAARLIFTDSGGVQKEAFFYDVPCVTMRSETEWVETIEMGMNTLTGANTENIIEAANNVLNNIGNIKGSLLNPYGDGKSAEKIIAQILDSGNKSPNYV